MSPHRQSARFVTDDTADTQELVVDVSDWSETSRRALAETIEGLAQLEECIGDPTRAASSLLRFRRSMSTLLRDLRSRDLIQPVELQE